ncbi:RraA family protein [Herbaspirillum sp. 1130]|uniref:RraA family protein n=1 Tax=Herbaspirillum sp. 1130 TaxID=2806562 RepID=UPI001AEB7F14|nr:RraA family protein [Herbaspirillum sp. 1130]MBP1318293.1 RraA family protein [Herbaspirillum sp. 1130]
MAANRLGARISPDFERVSKQIIEVARGIPAAVIGDVSHRLFSFRAGFQNYSKKALTLAGPAFTVKVRPGDNLFLHKALDIAQPGDIIVCDAGGALENAIIGEMMGRYAESRGIAGIIIDGATRDAAGLATLPIPVYARGLTPNGPWKSGPGQIGYPVAAGGVVVNAGDLVVADEDGVIVLPKADAEAIIEIAKKHVHTEEKWAEQIRNKEWPRGWVDDAIAQIG